MRAGFEFIHCLYVQCILEMDLKLLSKFGSAESSQSSCDWSGTNPLLHKSFLLQQGINLVTQTDLLLYLFESTHLTLESWYVQVVTGMIFTALALSLSAQLTLSPSLDYISCKDTLSFPMAHISLSSMAIK